MQIQANTNTYILISLPFLQKRPSHEPRCPAPGSSPLIYLQDFFQPTQGDSSSFVQLQISPARGCHSLFSRAPTDGCFGRL